MREHVCHLCDKPAHFLYEESWLCAEHWDLRIKREQAIALEARITRVKAISSCAEFVQEINHVSCPPSRRWYVASGKLF